MMNLHVERDGRMLRVRVSDSQAIISFPYLSTYGVGFWREDADPDRHLPVQCQAKDIYEHIKKNALDADEATCMEAIRLIREAVYEDGLVQRLSPDEQRKWDEEQASIREAIEKMFVPRKAK